MSDWLIDTIVLASIRLREILNDTVHNNKQRKLKKARKAIVGKRRYKKRKKT